MIGEDMIDETPGVFPGTPRLATEIHAGAVTVLVLRGEADGATLGQLCAALEAAAESCPERPVVADLRAVSLLDGAGLQALVDTHKRLARGGCRLLVLSARGTQPDRVLLLGGLDRILSLIHSLDEIGGPTDAPGDGGPGPAR